MRQAVPLPAASPTTAAGLSRHFTRLPRPVEIIQSDHEIVFHHEYFDVRRTIPTDGEPPRPE